jgi:chemotaxis protein CheX
MPKETVWDRRARKVRAAKAAKASVRHEVAAPARSEPSAQEDPPVRLAEVLDLSAAGPLARALLERRGRPTVIDARLARRPGAQCLQVLLSAIRTWESDAVPLAFANCGPLLIEHLRFLGIEPTVFTDGAK